MADAAAAGNAALPPEATRAEERRSETFLSSMDKKSGVYVIAPRDAVDGLPASRGKIDMSKQFWVKVGLGKNLRHRLESYLLYWPHGFYVFGVILTNKGSARRIATFESTTTRAGVVEESIHQYLRAKGRHMVSGHTHSEEWFELSLKDIDTMLATVSTNLTTTTNLKMTRKKNKMEWATTSSERLVFPASRVLNYMDDLMFVLNTRRVTRETITMHRSLKSALEMKNRHHVQTQVKRKTTRRDPKKYGKVPMPEL